MTDLNKVCIFCASSRQIDLIYIEAARQLGKILAEKGIEIVYGGGSVGLMGALAEGALKKAGKITGILPEFMIELEWAHPELTNLVTVPDMHERKKRMIKGTSAVIALPGGTGTLEELLEVITLKRLGLYLNPIVVVNVNNFFDPLLQQFDQCVKEKFIDPRHLHMWTVVREAQQVLDAIRNAPEWSETARNFAAI